MPTLADVQSLKANVLARAREELERRRVNDPVDIARREERELQSMRGFIDADGVLQGGLMAFIRHLWHVLEPRTELVEGWPLYAVIQHLEAVTHGEITRLLINVPPGFMKSLLTDVFWPAWEWGPMGMSHLRYVAFSYGAHLTERDNDKFRDLMLSPEYRELWGQVFQVRKVGVQKITNDKTGWKFASSIGGIGTGERGDRVILDDAHNVKEAESDTVRGETVRWVREGMSNRLNDQEFSAIVVIMQRVHEDDTAGALLENSNYVHLMVPMEYDSSRHCSTVIGWEDPRTEDGELAWEDRFSADTVAQLKLDIGPYAYCTPAESPVLMANLTMKPIGKVAVGDQVVGFTVNTKTQNSDEGYSRRRLARATVLSISTSVQKLVKITLASGKVLRCTVDHKWYTGKCGGKPLYREAKIGRRLMRVCPDQLPELSGEDLRDAGWLSGFFDGEGSVVSQQRRPNHRTSALISFTQGADRNLPLCHRLEGLLTKFGFEFGYNERVREDLDIPTPLRWYYIKGPRLETYQRFLHIVRPHKWENRIVEGAFGAKFIAAKEDVVSIESDGDETVYGLETTTGNYVVWGLASSNSAQYQQEPAPRGGGIFKRDWWQMWEPGSEEAKAIAKHEDGRWPPFEFVLGSLDGAYTEKEENDPTAMTVWGVFRNKLDHPKIALIHAWRKRLILHGPVMAQAPGESRLQYLKRVQPHWGVVEWAAHTCRVFKIDLLLIEAKASGISTAQSIQSLYGDEGFATQLEPVKGDKVARAQAIVPFFSNFMVYAPSAPKEEMPGDTLLFRAWAQMVIDEMAVFPKGRYKDLTDTASQAFRYLRATGFARLEAEVETDKTNQMRYKPKSKPLYPGSRV